VLRDDGALSSLTAELGDVDRLVLLGDVLELRHGPVRDSLAVAEPVLAALGGALPGAAEVVIVPGNHDHHLLSGWLERASRARAAPPLGLETDVDWRESEPLGALAAALGGKPLRVRYPGVWLRNDVYATHGHYLDRHTTVPMFERLGAGAMARVVREPEAGPRSPVDYERVLAPIYSWIHAIAQRGGPDVGASSHGASASAWRLLAGDRRRGFRRRALVAAFPAIVAGINRARIGPVRADISGPELRRAALLAFGEVLRRLQVSAPHVIFGHTHRAGPLPSDDAAEWRSGPTSLINTGCWVHEPSFLGRDPRSSPYRAGFAVELVDAAGPRSLNLLD
jgi:hypothetical protein